MQLRALTRRWMQPYREGDAVLGGVRSHTQEVFASSSSRGERDGSVAHRNRAPAARRPRHGTLPEGGSRLNQGDHEVATKEYEWRGRATRLHQCCATLGNLYVRGNRLPEALTQIQSAVEIEPDNVQARVLLRASSPLWAKTVEAVNPSTRPLRLDPPTRRRTCSSGLVRQAGPV